MRRAVFNQNNDNMEHSELIYGSLCAKARKKTYTALCQKIHYLQKKTEPFEKGTPIFKRITESIKRSLDIDEPYKGYSIDKLRSQLENYNTQLAAIMNGIYATNAGLDTVKTDFRFVTKFEDGSVFPTVQTKGCICVLDNSSQGEVFNLTVGGMNYVNYQIQVDDITKPLFPSSVRLDEEMTELDLEQITGKDYAAEYEKHLQRPKYFTAELTNSIDFYVCQGLLKNYERYLCEEKGSMEMVDRCLQMRNNIKEYVTKNLYTTAFLGKIDKKVYTLDKLYIAVSKFSQACHAEGLNAPRFDHALFAKYAVHLGFMPQAIMNIFTGEEPFKETECDFINRTMLREESKLIARFCQESQEQKNCDVRLMGYAVTGFIDNIDKKVCYIEYMKELYTKRKMTPTELRIMAYSIRGGREFLSEEDMIRMYVAFEDNRPGADKEARERLWMDIPEEEKIELHKQYSNFESSYDSIPNQMIDAPTQTTRAVMR